MIDLHKPSLNSLIHAYGFRKPFSTIQSLFLVNTFVVSIVYTIRLIYLLRTLPDLHLHTVQLMDSNVRVDSKLA